MKTAGNVGAMVAEDRAVVGGYEAGGFADVPHSAQNFALAFRLALQLVQCFCMGVPHSAQNFAPTWTGLWQLPHSVVAAAAGAAAAGAAAAGAAAAGAGAGCGGCAKPGPPPAKPGPGGGGLYGAWAGACII
jgi:hypothetical protein